AYHQRLNGQVERQLRYAAKLIGAFWYTCWVDAGQPELGKMRQQPSAAEQLALDQERKEAASAPTVAAPGHDE
ncbi:MAG: S1/P1 Nuclease, partial [Hymenobacter sp.]